MSGVRMRPARWHRHLNHVSPPAGLRSWLPDPGSLTAKLIAHSSQFRVRKLSQRLARCTVDEYAAVGLPEARQVQQREVLLECDGRIVVFAHTIVPLQATTDDWPFFGALGERSLGTTLFGDPRVSRGQMEYARLTARHPFVQRARQAGCEVPDVVYARRCLYRRRRGVLLVTELFLPGVLKLTPRPKKESI